MPNRGRHFYTITTEIKQVNARWLYIITVPELIRKTRETHAQQDQSVKAAAQGQAREVNFVWNYCNELQITMFNRERRFLSGYDFAKFTRGATKEGLHLHSQTVHAIAEEYATRRRQFRRVRLRWRKSTGSRRSLGWIPFKKTAIRAAHGQVKFAGQWLSLWDSYGLEAYSIRAGNLCEDTRGRWYCT